MGAAREVVEREYEALNAHDTKALASIYSDDAEIGTPAGRLRGGAAVAQFAATFLLACPDAKWTVTNVVDAGDAAAVEAVFEGTQTGPLQTPGGRDISPTGRRIVNQVASIARVKADQIVSETVYFDQMAIMAQLGLMPEAQPTG